MAKYQDYMPLGKGQGERYRNPATGEEISSRRYRELRSQAKAGNEPDIVTKPDNDIIRDFIDQKQAAGVTLSERRALQNRELRAIVAALHNETGAYKNAKGKTVYPPDSPKARALILIGRRNPSWDWAVGETPDS